jgi:hypothetical protein
MKFQYTVSLFIVCLLASSCKTRTGNSGAVRSVDGSEIGEEACPNIPRYLESLNGNLGFEKDSEAVEFRKAVVLMGKKNSSLVVCPRQKFLEVFGKSGGPVLFAAGPSGLGINNDAEKSLVSTLKSLMEGDLQENINKIPNDSIIISGISQRESGALTMDGALDSVVNAINKNRLKVYGAIAGKAYAWGTDENALPAHLDVAYIPTPGEAAGKDYDMADDKKMPVKSAAVLAALNAGRVVKVYLFDGGNFSYNEVSKILDAVVSGEVSNPQNLSLHISMGWGYASAKKIALPASIRILNKFYADGKTPRIVKTTFSVGHVLDPKIPVTQNIPDKNLQFKYLQHLSEGLRGAFATEKKDSVKTNLAKEMNNFAEFCREKQLNTAYLCSTGFEALAPVQAPQ